MARKQRRQGSGPPPRPSLVVDSNAAPHPPGELHLPYLQIARLTQPLPLLWRSWPCSYSLAMRAQCLHSHYLYPWALFVQFHRSLRAPTAPLRERP
eukprot:scaffold319995_cov37-Tisochrysis_lutea.AAC.2